MNLLSPIMNLNELRHLIRIGVNEVYCGVLTEEWLSNYSNVASINRMDRRNGNLKNYEELNQIIDYAHNYGVKVFLTLNGLYTQSQQYILNKELNIILETDIDALIIVDFGMLHILNNHKIEKEIHASTGLTVFNSENVKFLRDQGVKRIVLPRDLKKYEIFQLIENNPEMQFEVFAMNGRCQNVDGFCTFQHGVSDLTFNHINRFLIYSKAGHRLQELLIKVPIFIREKIMELVGNKVCSTACSIKYKMTSKQERLYNEEIPNNFQSKIYLPPRSNFINEIYSCGGCDIYDFLKFGVTSIKIVGRTFPLERKIKDARYLKQLINIAKYENLSSKEFNDYARKLYKDIYGISCKKNCYYPNDKDFFNN